MFTCRNILLGMFLCLLGGCNKVSSSDETDTGDSTTIDEAKDTSSRSDTQSGHSHSDVDSDSDTRVPYDVDTNTSNPVDTDIKIEYDSEVDPNASFNFDFSGLPFVGVNMSGPEWDGGTNSTIWPNQYLTDEYASYLKYFRSWNMTTVRLPFKWEYLQPVLGEAFAAQEFERLKVTVFHLRKYGAKVLIDMHNYARYDGEIIGSDLVLLEHYTDAWKRLAEAFKAYPEVMFGIMNEPHSLDTVLWVEAANAAIKTIRETGAQNLIFVNANGWSGAHSWMQTWTDASDTPISNGEAMLQITDPLGEDYTIFEVHQYLNEVSSDWGECKCADWELTDGCTNTTVGSHRLQTFTQWLRDNNKKGFLGEFGSQDDATCIAAVDDMLNFIEENGDVYVGWTWWGAGPGCAYWQKPIDPYCWDEATIEDMQLYLQDQSDGNLIPAQARTLLDHLVK